MTASVRRGCRGSAPVPATVAYDELIEATLDRLAKHLTTFIDLDRLLNLTR